MNTTFFFCLTSYASVKKRDALIDHLAGKDISCGIHYPVPIHLQNAYAVRGFKKGDFPITEKVAKEILSLPMFSQLTKDQIVYVVSKMKDFSAAKP